MDGSHALLAQLSAACEAATNLVIDAAATHAAAQPIGALSDYDSERLEAAIKGSVVRARDGRFGIVKIAYRVGETDNESDSNPSSVRSTF